jgi:hypothetical protein
MTLQIKHKPKSGCWFTEHGKTVWREYLDKFGTLYKDYSPLEIEGISREANYTIVFVREYVDINSFNGKIKRWFAQDIEMHLAENVDKSIVIKFDSHSRKFFISDLKPVGQTFLAPLESTPELIVSKSEPYPCDQTFAKDVLSRFSYGYGKVEVDANGNIEYYQTC